MNSDTHLIWAGTILAIVSAGEPDIIDATIAALLALAKHLGG